MVDQRINNGYSSNFYKKVSVTSTTFGSAPDYMYDAIITFVTRSIMFLNEATSGVVEYSFDGNNVHGELDPTLPSKGIVYDNRVVSKIWLRVKSGSSGTIVVRIDAWA